MRVVTVAGPVPDPVVTVRGGRGVGGAERAVTRVILAGSDD
jgi:hypothetical protein